MRDRRTVAAMPDADLETALRTLGGELAWPSISSADGLDAARRARLRIEQGTPSALAGRLRRSISVAFGRPVRRALALALVAALAIAALAAALGFGLPGIRFAPAPTTSPPESGQPATPSPVGTPSPTVSGPPGTGLGLGEPIPLDATSSAVDFPLLLPPASEIGAPATGWLLEGRLSLVWPSGGPLPPMERPDVGLILTQFRGSIEPGYFRKIIDQNTTITPVTVNGGTGYWISGAPHEIILVDPSGEPVADSRRSVGDTLIWASGDLTYRLESSLGREDAIALAESLQ